MLSNVLTTKYMSRSLLSSYLIRYIKNIYSVTTTPLYKIPLIVSRQISITNVSPNLTDANIGNYATVGIFDEIRQYDLTEMLSNLNRGGKDTQTPNSIQYWDPTAVKF